MEPPIASLKNDAILSNYSRNVTTLTSSINSIPIFLKNILVKASSRAEFGDLMISSVGIR